MNRRAPRQRSSGWPLLAMALLGLALAGLGPGTARTGAAARGLVLVQAGAPGGLEARREAIQRLRIARQVGLGS